MFPVEAFQKTLEKITKIFRALDIRFHLTGGIASTLYGEPRMTQDIDIVVDSRALAERLDNFISLLGSADWLFDADSIRSAVSKQEMFQLLDNVEVLKLDIYPRELIPGELQRSRMVEVFAGIQLPVVSRVDAAAAKLIWISKGSHKSRRDVRQIYRASSESERESIREMAAQLGLEPLLAEVLNEPDEIA